MADNNKSSSSNNTDEASISHSEPTDTPQTAPTKKLNKEEHQEPETTPESKRRKTCATALDKIQEITLLSNGNSSFTFDTKLTGCPPDYMTPKFGSFNHPHHVVSNQVKKMKKKNDQQLLNNFEDKDADEQGEEEDKD